MIEIYAGVHLVIDVLILLGAFLWLTAFALDRGISRFARLFINRQTYYKLIEAACKEAVGKGSDRTS